MDRYVRFVLLFAILLSLPLTLPAEGWLTQFGGLGPEVVFDIVETEDGHVCATGTFTNSATFGNDERQVTLRATDIQDIYVACFDRQGMLASAVQLGAGISDQPRALAALPGGDILVTGYFSGKIGIGQSGGVAADGSVDMFLLRMTMDGREVWARRFGGRYADTGNALAVAGNGDILIAGQFRETFTVMAGEDELRVESAGGHDAVVLRLSADGTPRWLRRLGGKGRDLASRVITAANGDVIVAGTFEGNASLAGAAGQLLSRGSADAWLAVYSAAGKLRWHRQLGGKQREYLSGLAALPDGRVAVSGNFHRALQLPDGQQLDSAGSTDLFLAVFEPDGRLAWSQALGSPQVDESFDLVTAGDGRLLLAGHFQGDLSAGDTALLKASTSGNADAFLLEFDADGRFQQALTAHGDGVETAFAVTVLADGGVALAGFFSNDLRLSAGAWPVLQKRGKTDVFLLRLAPMMSGRSKAAARH